MPAISLSAPQQQLYDALVGKAPKCANMYFGALKVLADADNPERLHLAAHSLRELMDSIGPFLNVAVLDVDLSKGQGNLKDKFASIERLLGEAEEKSGNWTNGSWSGPINPSTEKLLCECQIVRRWCELNVKLRKTKIGSLIMVFDPLHSALPADIQELHITAWELTRDYFVRVAHHKDTNVEEFLKWLLHFERMLQHGLAPVAKQNLTDIDAIIAAVEGK